MFIINILKCENPISLSQNCLLSAMAKIISAHRALQARVCRQMMTAITDEEKKVDEPQRVSLVELKAKGKKKAVIPINRVACSVGCKYRFKKNKNKQKIFLSI